MTISIIIKIIQYLFEEDSSVRVKRIYSEGTVRISGTVSHGSCVSGCVGLLLSTVAEALF